MQPSFYYISGDGYPVVFIHGFCESGTLWKPLGETLSDEFKIICPDLPGFGKSILPPSGFSLTDIGDGLVSWLQSLGVSECVVIGHSLGGYVALEMLRKHPGFAKGIGLLNSSAFEDPADKKENRNKLIAFIQSRGVAPFIKTFVPSLFYPATAKKHQKTIDRISKEGISIQAASVMQYAAAMRDRRDSMDLLPIYKDKILLIAGAYDQNVPLEKSKEIAKSLQPENVHILPESAHMSVFEQSEMCYDAIRNFVRKIENVPKPAND